ncbi:MAG: GNAT family N-acetyltransferase [Lachnospiraceae bacterium]|nr:GNAT family N-acetyltransferase [Lachnospiraceae bacterium]
MYFAVKTKDGNDNRRITILHGTEEDWEPAMALAWRVFSKYDAKDYTREGSESFLRFISDNILKRMFLLGRYRMYVAKDGDAVVGMITLREHNHISLLFIDARYQHCGIGRALIGCVMDYLCGREVLPLDNEEQKILDLLYEKDDGDFCTVKSAPYALGFYQKLGFVQQGDAEENEGIISIPMRLKA